MKKKLIQRLIACKASNNGSEFILEGKSSFSDLLRAKVFPSTLVFRKSPTHKNLPGMVKNLIETYQIPDEVQIEYATGKNFIKFSSLTAPQDVIALFTKSNKVLHPPTNNNLHVILDKIRNPYNLGGILRTALGFGVCQVICVQGTVCPYNHHALQAATGSQLFLNIVDKVEPEFIPKLLPSNTHVYMSSSNSDNNVSVNNVVFERDVPTAIIFGNETRGISSAIQDAFQTPLKNLSIPISPHLDSFNVSIAASIVLYEYQKQMNGI